MRIDDLFMKNEIISDLDRQKAEENLKTLSNFLAKNPFAQLLTPTETVSQEQEDKERFDRIKAMLNRRNIQTGEF